VKIIIIFTFGVIVYFLFNVFIDTENQSGLMTKEPETSGIITEVLYPSNPDKSTVVEENKAAIARLDINCVKANEFYQNPKHLVLNAWDVNNFGFANINEVTSYYYSNEEDLVHAAEVGDERAMLILGVNYRWYTTMTSFQSVLIRPTELPRVKYQTKPYDRSIMEKSRYWLKQAALNNLLSGLGEISISYDREKEYLEKYSPENIESIQKARLMSLAFKKLFYAQSPEYFASSIQFLPKLETKQDQELFDKLFSATKVLWTEQRKALGYLGNEVLRPPVEFFELRKIQEHLCVDD